MEQKGKLPGCFKFGCFSCLALVALFVGIMLLIGAVQLTTEIEEPNPVERQAVHDLPPAPELPAEAARDRPPAIEVEPLPEEVELDSTPAPGVLRLDLRMGEFVIRPGEPGEPLKVEADYDENSFELVEEFQQNDDGTWTYDVAFGGRGGFLGLLLRGGAEGSRNRIEITIPKGHPIAIVGEIGMGESEIDLGGLWVERVDLEMSAGDHYLEFREPLPVPMAEFLIDSSMGGLEIDGLGQASPARVVVDHGMGELTMDLEGTWLNDAEIDVDFSMGQCRLYLPRDVRVEIDRASVGLGEKRISRRDQSALPEDAPTLTLRLAGSMGELRVED